MEDQAIIAAQIVSVLGASFLAGYISCFSQAGVPTLNVAPLDILVREFKVMYNIGKSTSPFIAVAVTFCNAFLAYQSRDSSRLIADAVSSFALYLAAALCVPCIVPYTILYMEPAVNQKLLDLGAKADKGVKKEDLCIDEQYIRQELVRWRGMNFVRATLVGAGALLSAVATLA